MGSLNKKISLTIFISAILMYICFIGAELLLIKKIKDDIEKYFNKEYAIIALHVAGENAVKPSFWRMLKRALIYELNINGSYSPSGSGGYTGKNHHLAILISDNKQISFAEWSFRKWGLVFEESELQPWDIIDNLSDSEKDLYRYEKSELRMKNGLNYNHKMLNDDKIRFYYRRVREGGTQ